MQGIPLRLPQSLIVAERRTGKSDRVPHPVAPLPRLEVAGKSTWQVRAAFAAPACHLCSTFNRFQASSSMKRRTVIAAKLASPRRWLDGYIVIGQGFSKGLVVQPKYQRGKLRARPHQAPFPSPPTIDSPQRAEQRWPKDEARGTPGPQRPCRPSQPLLQHRPDDTLAPSRSRSRTATRWVGSGKRSLAATLVELELSPCEQ